MRVARIDFQEHHAVRVHFGIEAFLGIDGLEVLLAPNVANGLRSTHADGMRYESDGLRLVREVEEADSHGAVLQLLDVGDIVLAAVARICLNAQRVLVDVVDLVVAEQIDGERVEL